MVNVKYSRIEPKTIKTVVMSPATAFLKLCFSCINSSNSPRHPLLKIQIASAPADMNRI